MKIALAIPILLCTIHIATAQPKLVTLQAQVQAMELLLQGEFNNFAQVYKEKEDKQPEVHEHIHTILKKVHLPMLGNHVLYVLQYLDGDSTKIYRQRLYSLVPNQAEGAVQLNIYSFDHDSLYYYAHNDTLKLRNLTMGNLSTTQGCAVYWKPTKDGYTGYTKPNACNFISKRTGKKIIVTDSLLLTANELWIRDQAVDENGEYVYGNKANIPHKLKRCIYYKGWLLLQKAGFNEAYHSMRNLLWHDQGKRIRLYTEDNTPTKYEVELAHVVYGSSTQVLKLAVYEVGISKAIMYTWASPGTNNIGINIRWLQAGLTRVQ